MDIRKHFFKQCLIGILAILIPLLGGCTKKSSSIENTTDPVAMIRGKDFCIRTSVGEYEPLFLNGVNLGVTKPGHFPGEFAIEKEEYLHWFELISQMNVNVIRVYVGQMPAFYDALYEFNKTATNPIYLMQGVYMNEELIVQYNDAFGGNGAIQDLFYSDIRNAVDMIHGSAEIKKLPGNAGGTYTSDVSQWVIGWILGVEWSSDLVMGTNVAHADKTYFVGTYVQTKDSSPFEVFLAGAAEEAVSYEEKKYDRQRPVSLCNWCTTDPLEHPNEPIPEMEDAVSVDTEHIRGSESFEAGFFASYHVYPYYPDFLSYDTKYVKEVDPYLAYLKELNQHHTMPVLISEYGIPASRGIAHANVVSGMSQGHVSERQQGEWLIALNQDIRASGCAGGMIFSWQDEWFKRTWNSMDYEDPDRRPFWMNVESPESSFGLMAFEPEEESRIVLDGDVAEWNREDLVIENDGVRIYARSDTSYLYLMVEGDKYDFDSDTLYVPLGVLDEQGITRYKELTFEDGAEFLLRINGKVNSALYVDSYYDLFQYDYSQNHDFFNAVPGQYEKDSGFFNKIYLAMNKPLHLRETNKTIPFERFDTGELHFGNGDPSSEEYDSLADICAGSKGVEIRLPWMLLGFSDPSQKQVIGDFHVLNGIKGVSTEGVRIGICRDSDLEAVPMQLHTWENWELPQTHERLKASYYMLQEYFTDKK